MSIEAGWRDLFSGIEKPPPQTFTLFSQLPTEIRLLIWNAALPPRQQGVHTAYNIWQSDWTNKRNYRLPQVPGAPNGLLRTCYESREVALASGSYLKLSYTLWFLIPWPHDELIWISKDVKTLMMPINIDAFSRITQYPKSLESVAKLLATKSWLYTTSRILESTKRQHNIRTILNGIMWIPFRYSVGNNTETHPCVGSETAVVPLDDPKMMEYLTSAFESHAVMTLRERLPQACYRKSARKFFAFAKYRKRYLDDKQRFRPPEGIILKGAIVFGRPHSFDCRQLERFLRVMDTFVCRDEDEEDVEEWDAGTHLGANGRVFQHWDSTYRRMIRNLIEE
ncbi:hypothetical protein HYE68_001822 [Fusarium pseudograminearum]|nr:hypothetical protein HYE68_001822 [Fusarium pseudograminearum]